MSCCRSVAQWFSSPRVWLHRPFRLNNLAYSNAAEGRENSKPTPGPDVTSTKVTLNGSECKTPREISANLLRYLELSDIEKKQQVAKIPFFTSGSYLAVTRSDSLSPTGKTRFVGICIAKRNRGLGSTFILRNVINGFPVEMTFELFSPKLIDIKVLKLERRRRAKLYYLRDKPLKYSTVSEDMEAVASSGRVSQYKRKKGAVA